MKISFDNGPRCGEEIEFALPEITVGREEDNVLRVPAAGVSRYHGVIQRAASGSWLVRDLGSTNGIKVNGVKIAGEKELAEGDSVEFGDQKIQVSGLGETAPPLVFNLLDAEQPGPSARATSRLPEEPPAAPKSEAKVEDLTALFTAGAGTLFDPNGRKKAAKEPETAPLSGRKRRFSSHFFYVLVVCIAVIGISAAMLLMKPGQPGRKPEKAAAAAGPFSLFFERSVVSRDNVFRFSLLLENDRLAFTVDDVKSRRHVSRTEKISNEAVELLRDRVGASGIWNEIPPVSSPGEDATRKRRVMIADGTRVKELSYTGGYTPTSFGLVETLVSDLAETYGIQTISLSPEELMRLAESNFTRAEDFYANREAKNSYLRDAVRRYRVVVGALEQFSPRPSLWNRARKRLEEAESLRARKLDNLEMERVRLGQLEDFDGMRLVFLQIMELADEESPEYYAARERLFKLDAFLRGRKR